MTSGLLYSTFNLGLLIMDCECHIEQNFNLTKLPTVRHSGRSAFRSVPVAQNAKNRHIAVSLNTASAAPTAPAADNVIAIAFLR